MYRIVGQLWIGDVTLGSMHCQHCTQGAAPAVLDDVSKLLRARGLTHYTPVDALVAGRQILEHFDRSILCRTLFVGGNEESHPARMLRVSPDKMLAGDEHGRQAAFHVGAAATIQVRAAQAGFERRRIPALARPRRYYIGMPGENQQRSAFAVGRPEVAHVPKRQISALKTQRLEVLHHKCLAAVVRGRDRLPANELATQLQCSFHAEIPPAKISCVRVALC